MDRFRVLADDVDRREVRMNGMKLQVVLLWWTFACVMARLSPLFTVYDVLLWLAPVAVGIVMWKWCR